MPFCYKFTLIRTDANRIVKDGGSIDGGVNASSAKVQIVNHSVQ